MVEVHIRNLDADVVASLKHQAKQKGLSLQADLRGLLTDAARRPRLEAVARLEALQDAIYAECGPLPDSTALIREERERLG